MNLLTDQNSVPEAAVRATKNGPMGLQIVARKASTRPASPSVVNPGMRDSILNLAYRSQLDIRSFRHIARLLRVPESTVFSTVIRNTRPTTPPIGRAA